VAQVDIVVPVQAKLPLVTLSAPACVPSDVHINKEIKPKLLCVFRLRDGITNYIQGSLNTISLWKIMVMNQQMHLNA
jgi:hypothetical protein